MSGFNGNRLGTVHTRSSTQADDHISLMRDGHLCPGCDIVGGRVRLNLSKMCYSDVNSAQYFLNTLILSFDCRKGGRCYHKAAFAKLARYITELT